MPRAPRENVTKAEKMFRDGMSMVDIAKKLGISAGTVRSWKNRYGWGDTSKKNDRNVAKEKNKKSATLQKRKKGGQPGNQNAKGGKGNTTPHKPPSRYKHGGYTPVFMDTLDSDEKDLLDSVPEDEELLLREQIQLYSVRERRIMKAINKYRDMDEEAVLDMEIRQGFYKQLPQIAQTTVTNRDNIILRLEAELSNVQNKKTKAIEALYKLKLEKQKLENDKTEDNIVDDWIAAVMGEDDLNE